jgi:hypothetical protein
MSDSTGRRRNPPNDPTSEPSSDPVPTSEDVVNRYRQGHDTPRRYEQPSDHDEDPASMPAERKSS